MVSQPSSIGLWLGRYPRLVSAATAPFRWLSGHIFVVFLLWASWLALEYLVFGPFSFVRIWDNGESYVPARIGQALALTEGGFSFLESAVGLRY